MGNCSGICAQNFSKIKVDILLIEKNDKKRDIYDINKLIFLQKKIKHFLKRKKIHKSNHSSNKSAKHVGSKKRFLQDKYPENNLIVHYPYNSHSKKTSSKSQNFKNDSIYKNSIVTKSNKYDSSPKNFSPKNNRSPKNRSPKNKNRFFSFPKKINSRKSLKNNDTNNLIEEINICLKYNDDEPNDDNSIFIPTLKPDLFEKEIFKGDPFRNGIRKKKYKNDPRDIFNNMRKKYPKIIEEKSSYIGEWLNGKRDGLGLLCLDNEFKFIGHFSENNIDGYGRFWNKNGDSYKGLWKNYQAEGWGIYRIKTGAFFRGVWSENKPNGFGIERWPRGSIFFGYYFMGNKNGIGVINFENKAWYEGEFKNGIISGIGSFFFEDGRKYQGMWKNNKMDGYGYIIWPDKNEYEGEFKDDKKEGFGICKIGNKTFMGIWHNNKLEGKVIIIKDGKYKKQYWENGKASKNLSIKSPIAFENFAQEYIKNEIYQKEKIK